MKRILISKRIVLINIFICLCWKAGMASSSNEAAIVMTRADCQRAVKTSHEWALENQPL